jgi:hypothetical protein
MRRPKIIGDSPTLSALRGYYLFVRLEDTPGQQTPDAKGVKYVTPSIKPMPIPCR